METPSSTTVRIGQFFVYNFSGTASSPTASTSTASSGVFCRICHDGDVKEELVSPCRCAGTVGLVHLSCMERWLSTSNSDICEICHFQFVTARQPRSFREWIYTASSGDSQQRSLCADMVCFFLLTPLVVVSAFLCIDGAIHHVDSWDGGWAATCLVTLGFFLGMVYMLWAYMTVRYHFRKWRVWRRDHQRVKVVVNNDANNNDPPPSSVTSPRLEVPARQFTETPAQKERLPTTAIRIIPAESSESLNGMVTLLQPSPGRFLSSSPRLNSTPIVLKEFTFEDSPKSPLETRIVIPPSYQSLMRESFV